MSRLSLVKASLPVASNDMATAQSRRPVASSIWQEALPSLGTPYIGGPRRVDTVVIGGGLTGLSAAFNLLESQPTREVLVLEAERVGHGASSRSTGMLTPGVGQDLAALVRRVGKDAARAMYRQSLHAVSYIDELTRREGIDCELRMTGQLIVARGRSGRKRLDAQATIMEALDLPCERLDHESLAHIVKLAPDSASTGNSCLPAALRLPTAGLLHPGKLLSGLAQSILRQGGEIYENTRVVEITKTQPATVRMSTGETLVADHVVLATNGYSPHLGLMRGRILPVHLGLVLTEPLEPQALDRLGWAGREAIIDSRRLFNYFRLTEDNRILFGGGLPRYLWGGATEEGVEDEAGVTRLMASCRRTFPAEVQLQINRSWSGVIGYVLDTLPVIERLRDYRAAVFAGGWCGHGIALSVSSGAWVAHLITHQRPPENLPWFRDSAPLLPLESGRWLSIPMVSRAMSALDRL